eukprot:CAMPEP_0201253670 /NCGR_PEP_ID=MMETSP0852-20130820/67570_1 /ASSEMBLY_ACC=CAM_ASM_000632 /TAXON_ID=183588 /ORGANISM="Pseudo-nitzschia fraudulenta, Strain WWA7" /LENGTH=142 /DNA_ID=CAMNT_0047553463 /DNA_START=293 /DNA_END=721 /DNA_ORIENTATION=+
MARALTSSDPSAVVCCGVLFTGALLCTTSVRSGPGSTDDDRFLLGSIGWPPLWWRSCGNHNTFANNARVSTPQRTTIGSLLYLLGEDLGKKQIAIPRDMEGYKHCAKERSIVADTTHLLSSAEQDKNVVDTQQINDTLWHDG